jgi:putative endonuclease
MSESRNRGRETGQTARESPRQIGDRGEAAALAELLRCGYRILWRNWALGRGRNEIDLIAEDHGEVVFVEVKTRGPGSLRSPASAVDDAKRRRIRRAAGAFLSRYREPSPHRFDVVSVLTDEGGRVVSVEIARGAFE